MTVRARALCAILLMLISTGGLAHSFGRVYNLPVPVWMYLYGAAAALALSFLIIAWFATTAPAAGHEQGRDISGGTLVRLASRLRLVRVGQGFSLVLLLLCIATGLWGTRNAYTNFSMTWFWVVFVLGFSYFTALVGDFYRQINPWCALAELVDKVWKNYSAGRFAYPERLGHWPALVLYMAFIWIELFGGTGPRGLGALLLGYTALNLVGIGLIGRQAWFGHCEFFAVFFRLLGLMAPLGRATDSGALHLRTPCAGLVRARVGSLGLLLFILFMLSSTAFDGLRETVPWMRLFWMDFYGLVQPWVGTNQIVAYKTLRPIYEIWVAVALLASPFLYLGVYWSFIVLMRRLMGTGPGVRELALRFAPSLLPIALVYHLTHYYTLFLTQGIKLVGLISDPFGWRWNLFGTVHWLRAPWVLDAGVVWHTQVSLIVGGHIVSVYIAHLVAMDIYGDRRRAALSQLPMLVLMMLFTAAGLWILAQPIQSG